MKAPLSVCIIAGDEARRIGPALESVREWAAEILVVLNEGSADGTEEICRKAGARVFREPWKGHVAQKNSVADKATQPWLLGLDADEEVTPALRAEISAVLAADAPAADNAAKTAAYSFPRLSQYLGRWIRHGDWYPDRKVRLWRRGAARWGGVNPHDRLEVAGGIGRLRGELLHRSNEDLNHQLAKIRAYSDAFVEDRRARGRGFSVVEALTRPPWRFVRGYVLRAGFLDGWAGLTIAVMTAFYTFVKHAKLRETPAEAGGDR